MARHHTPKHEHPARGASVVDRRSLVLAERAHRRRWGVAMTERHPTRRVSFAEAEMVGLEPPSTRTGPAPPWYKPAAHTRRGAEIAWQLKNEEDAERRPQTRGSWRLDASGRWTTSTYSRVDPAAPSTAAIEARQLQPAGGGAHYLGTARQEHARWLDHVRS